MPKPAPLNPPHPSPRRRATHVTLPEALIREARELEINLSQACERGLASEVAVAKSKKWLQESRAAMESWNDYVEQHGLPLSEFRQF